MEKKFVRDIMINGLNDNYKIRIEVPESDEFYKTIRSDEEKGNKPLIFFRNLRAFKDENDNQQISFSGLKLVYPPN